MKNKSLSVISDEIIENKIFMIRGKKVMFDKDLAKLYGVTTGNLNKAVKRNLERFPEDFMFQLDKNEFKNLMFQIGISSWGGTRKIPNVFTEQGVAMLSSVLKSKRAIQVNIQIMRTFTKIREMIISNSGLRRKIEELENKYNGKFEVVFKAINNILIAQTKDISRPTKKIGFKTK